MFSPILQPSKSRKDWIVTNDDHEVDDSDDKLLKPKKGFQRLYVVPRRFHCLSENYIDLINYFGDQDGFEIIIKTIEKHYGIKQTRLRKYII